MPAQKRTWDGIPVLRDSDNLPKVISSLQALITFSASCDDLKEQIEIVQDYTKKLENPVSLYHRLWPFPPRASLLRQQNL